MRKALATRLTTGRVLELLTLPPVMRLPGQSPNQEVKCLTVGKREGSKPNSDSRVSTVSAPKPSIWVKSTPQIRYLGVRKSKLGALPEGFLPRRLGLGRGCAVTSTLSANSARH